MNGYSERYLENKGRSRARASNTQVMYQCHMNKSAKLDDLASHDKSGFDIGEFVLIKGRRYDN
jgi:hypothetical protein